MPFVTDKDIAKKIDDLALLHIQLDEVKEKLATLKLEAGVIEDDLRPLLDAIQDTDQRILETKKSTLVVKQRGYERRSPKYKKAFEAAYNKVNAAIKKILDRILKKHTEIIRVQTSMAARLKENIDEASVSVVDKALIWIRKQVSQLASFIRSQHAKIDKNINILKRLEHL